eukprot:UN30944
MMSYQANTQNNKSSPTGQTMTYPVSKTMDTLPFPNLNQMNFPFVPVQVQVPTEFFMYDPENQKLTQLDPRTINFDSMTGLAIAPQGYTAIYTTAPQIPQSQQTSVSSDNININNVSSTRSRGQTPEPVHQTQPTQTVAHKPKRKFPHRSKQVRIQEVHDEVAQFFNPLGLYAFSETEVLRGEDTCRVHVKTYQGLNQILDVLKEVYEHPKIELKRIATPISMKNRYQKKGFIVYMKLANTNQVPLVQAIFEEYKDLYKKCDIAKPKTDLTKASPTNKPQAIVAKIPVNPVKKVSTSSNVNKVDSAKVITCNIASMMPRAMTKQASVGA